MTAHGPPAKEVELKPDKPINRHAAQGNGSYFEDIPKYVHTQDKNIEDPKGTTDLRDKTDKSISDRPTTASAKKGSKDLPGILAQVGQAAVHLQNMYPMMASVSSILSGLSSSNDDETTSSGIKEIIDGALLNAMIILTKKQTYDKTLRVFENAIKGDFIYFIDVDFREVVTGSIETLKQLAEEYGPDNIPLPVYETVTELTPVPSPVVQTVPSMYTQQYYLKKNDPYPGFIKWISDDFSSYVYTERKLGDNYYISANEEARAISENEIADFLNDYVKDETMTAQILNSILLQQCVTVGDNVSEKTVGKDSTSQMGQQLLQQLLGYIATATNLQKAVQLPQSVLNQGSISSSLQKYEEITAKHKKMQQFLDKAF